MPSVLPRLGAAAAIVFAVAASCTGAAVAEPTVAYQAGFEAESAAAPPAGWSMWGAEAFKAPANYTRDTTDPHTGVACFRIHHPANTAGYVVSAPEQAIRPQPATIVEVSFWARAAKPGTGQFGFSAYQTINPYVDAPSPGFHKLDVGPEWKEFRFAAREGFDFFASRSAYILLTVRATMDEKEEQTLWLDDVVATLRPDPQPGGLVDPDSLAYTPLAQPLSPGDELAITVDAGRRLRPATRLAGGVSFHRVCGWTGQPYDREGAFTLPPRLVDAIRDLRLPMTRFYAVGDEPFGVEGALDRVQELCSRLAIPAADVVLELESQGAERAISPDVWGGAVAYAARRGWGLRHWEIANEPYSSQWGAKTGGAFPTAEAYIAHVQAVSQAIRQAQPQARVGVAVWSNSMAWGNQVLKQTAGSYDFVVAHHYAGFDSSRLEPAEQILRENYRALDHILRLNALVRHYNPGREVVQLDTEWGMHSSGPKGERADYVDRNANLIGTLHRAVRLVHYVRDGMLAGASSWQMLSRTGGQGFGVLFSDAPEAQSLLYRLYWNLNRHVGEHVVAVTGTAPWYRPPAGTRDADLLAGPCTPVLATLSDDGKTLALVLVNGDWERPWPCRVALRGFAPGSATGVVLSDFRPGDPRDGRPLVERVAAVEQPLTVTVNGDTVGLQLPARAVVFLAVQRGAQ